jgi:hypothetical protein
VTIPAMANRRKRAAHFLLLPELADSPPNAAIVASLQELGYDVDLFAPGEFRGTPHGPSVGAHHAEYGLRWLAANALSPRWRQYDLFSGTSEDPLAVSAVLSLVHGRPSFALVDEIKSGSYRGDAREHWKALCRWAMRHARLTIVNDDSRVALLRDYAALPASSNVTVYPGCFHAPPEPAPAAGLRRQWGAPEGALVIGASGGCNLTSGTDWLVSALERLPGLHAVVQPLGMDAFARFLMEHLACRERLYIEGRRLSWREAWASAAGFDVGLAVYTNPAPQFQHMGTSSNRLCMYLAMGVPVIASAQPSFRFLEEYECGVLVGSQQEFDAAIAHLRANLDRMKANAARCAREYVAAPAKRAALVEALRRAVA